MVGTDLGRVLIVEDDALERRALSRVLRRRSFAVIPTSDVATTRRLIKARGEGDEFDVALVDFALGDGTALDVLELIRGHSPMVRIVIITGARTERLVELASQRVFVLPKPFTPETLVSLVEGLLDRRHPDPVAEFSEHYDLSEAEVAVLRAVAEGSGAEACMRKHRWSRSTVGTLWQRVFRKTKVRGQRDVIAALYRFAVERYINVR